MHSKGRLLKIVEPLQLIQSPTQATRNSPPATHQQDAISFEYIIANEPVPISPPAPVTPPSASWPLQSETLAPSTITSQTQSARRSFVQPAPPAPSTPPPTRRRRLSSTPRSGVTASPARTTFMARRRRTLTPFDRATSEFVAIERLRLRQEEKRDRQLHERETRRIEVDRERNQVDHERNQIDHERNQVDHERNLVLSRLGDIAQAWFDHYRSKEDTERIGTP
ncbi:hypothetical protein PYW08_010555 [Mythimna loreyi]|uniref:Uncharacterized protein n=1 Tax=Mythimna loreyi TaxID=667449 RepID=A0ACC2Q5Q8_9NEOP|nr:hypothetical protein PYW08_010555 [Mythimna loreyi]